MQGWQKKKSRIVHKNPWYRVREDDVITPNGTKGKYFVVEGASSVAIVAIDKDDYVYLVGQSRYPMNNAFSWEVITGGVGNLAPLKAAKKELQEEAGLKAKNWKKLGTFYHSNGHDEAKCTCYLATDLKKVKTDHEHTENIKITRKEIPGIEKMIKQNKIKDGLTISAFYKYLLNTKRK